MPVMPSGSKRPKGRGPGRAATCVEGSSPPFYVGRRAFLPCKSCRRVGLERADAPPRVHDFLSLSLTSVHTSAPRESARDLRKSVLGIRPSPIPHL
jgi:hypothetical protein